MDVGPFCFNSIIFKLKTEFSLVNILIYEYEFDVLTTHTADLYFLILRVFLILNSNNK